MIACTEREIPFPKGISETAETVQEVNVEPVDIFLMHALYIFPFAKHGCIVHKKRNPVNHRFCFS
jgi:hypothetical protein